MWASTLRIDDPQTTLQTLSQGPQNRLARDLEFDPSFRRPEPRAFENSENAPGSGNFIILSSFREPKVTIGFLNLGKRSNLLFFHMA